VRRRLEQQVTEEGLLTPRAIYGYLPCHAEGNQLTVLDADGQQELARFRFPRQLKPPHHCIADFFRPRDAGAPDLLGLFVVTIGPAASQRITELFEGHRYRDYLHLHGLAVEAAEAAAEYVHRQMRHELGFSQQEPDTSEALYSQHYRGARYSFGYPACPDLGDQRTLLPMLEAGRIGVSLTEGAQMVPEQSVSAIVVHHPAAKYFRV
jgi:5-methyltetrahydrofolate--homocysteine methyltransferase